MELGRLVEVPEGTRANRPSAHGGEWGTVLEATGRWKGPKTGSGPMTGRGDNPQPPVSENTIPWTVPTHSAAVF